MISSTCSEYPALTVKGAYKTATVFYLQRQRTSATNSRLDRSFEVFPVKPNRTSNPLKKKEKKRTQFCPSPLLQLRFCMPNTTGQNSREAPPPRSLPAWPRGIHDGKSAARVSRR